MRVAFAHYLSIPFIAGALGVLYHAWENEGAGGVWIVPFLLAAAFFWVFTPQINWWWYSKRPPALEEGVVAAITRLVPFYQQLDETNRKRFRDRLALTRMATNWTGKDMPDEIPPDLETAVAVQSVIVTWKQDDFLLHDLENIVIAPGPFLSPEHPYRHSSETYRPESCMLFSAKAAMDAFVQPDQHFNVVLYEYIKATLAERYRSTFPIENEEELWGDIAEISHWSPAAIVGAVGTREVDLLSVLWCLYYTFQDRFQQILPEWAGHFREYSQ